MFLVRWIKALWRRLRPTKRVPLSFRLKPLEVPKRIEPVAIVSEMPTRKRDAWERARHAWDDWTAEDIAEEFREWPPDRGKTEE